MAISSRNTLLAALAFIAFQAQAVNVTVAYQTSAEPAKVAQADNTFAKESGATVDWRKFDSGASIVRALASGDVQIGNLGSSPLAVAASQQVPIEVFLLASKLGNSEALVVKKTISKPEDLIGKRIAVPFISTTHYSLLAALKHWGIKPGQVEIVNLQPPAIIAAWQRGDIDGAYVWAPAVNALEKDGKVLTDSEQVGQWGAPTLDVWVVRKDFAEKHPGTIISNGVKIGFATEIKNAVIEAEATIGPQCFIADSVVANQAYLGAQVRTSNHRLDEQPVSVRTPEGIIATGCDKLGCYIGQRSRLGVQVIILPGRIISPNTQLGPRVIVERNLPTGTYSLRQELIRTGD